MIQKPSLLRVRDYPVNDKISIHVPIVDEIFEFGEMKYYSMAQSIIATPFDLMVELDDVGIDYETISDFQLFELMIESIAQSENDTRILFPNLDLKKFRRAENTQNGELCLWDAENDIIIDEMVALDIKRAMCEIHFWELPEGQAGNA